jgi:hypothetical protein
MQTTRIQPTPQCILLHLQHLMDLRMAIQTRFIRIMESGRRILTPMMPMALYQELWLQLPLLHYPSHTKTLLQMEARGRGQLLRCQNDSIAGHPIVTSPPRYPLSQKRLLHQQPQQFIHQHHSKTSLQARQRMAYPGVVQTLKPTVVSIDTPTLIIHLLIPDETSLLCTTNWLIYSSYTYLNSLQPVNDM